MRFLPAIPLLAGIASLAATYWMNRTWKINCVLIATLMFVFGLALAVQLRKTPADPKPAKHDDTTPPPG